MLASRQESRFSRFLFKVVHNQEILRGDCKEVLKTFCDETIDLCITSVPYNIGLNYNEYKDNKKKEEYLSWLVAIFTEVKRVLRPDGSLFLNVGSTNLNPWVAFEVAMTLGKFFVLQNHIIWVKSISVGDTSYGHFKPINSPRFLNQTFEHILHFTKNGDVRINRLAIGVPYVDKGNLRRKRNDLDLRCRGNCWFIPYETIRSREERGKHPAVFPQTLVEWCIRLTGFNEETVVCDPFLGSGTTLVVTKQLGIKGIGIEIDPEYCQWSCDRLLKSA